MVLTIATGNPEKAALLRSCLAGHELRVVEVALREPQADSIAEVARAKAADAFARLGGPVVVEDSGLVIPALRGFPGPYTKYALATIGGAGLVCLAPGAACLYTSCVALARADGSIAVGEHALPGTLGSALGDGPELWQVFVPTGEHVPFAALPAAARGPHLAGLRDTLARWFLGALSG